MPNLLSPSIIDSHLHLWDQTRLPYEWLDGSGLGRRYLPDDMPASLHGTPLEGFIVVEADCRTDLASAEADWIGEVTEGHPLLGVVAHANPASPTFSDDLDTLATNRRLVGVRQLIQGRQPGFSQSLADGMDELTARDLTFDICCFHNELEDVIEFVERSPGDLQFVLDHLGKPPVGDHATFQRWATLLGDLSQAPNVVCKLSGLATEQLPDADNDPALLTRYVQKGIAAFGTNRVLYGSDWPVVTARVSMEAWVTIVVDAIGTDPAAHLSVFRDNTVRAYGLDTRVDGTGTER